MERPDLEVLDELQAVITDYYETQALVKDLKAKINEVAASMGERVSDPELLRRAVTWAYWMTPEVNVSSLAEAVLGSDDTYRLR